MPITFANSLDPDQDQQNIGDDLDPNHLTLMVFLKEFFEKLNFEKQSADDKTSMKNYPVCKDLESFLITEASSTRQELAGARCLGTYLYS